MYTLTIEGTPRELVEGTLVIEESTSVRSVARLQLSNPGTYRPSRRDEILITDGVNTRFGGLINVIQEDGAGGEPISHIRLTLDCVDFNTYADWQHVVNGGFPAGTTLESALTSLAAGLSAFGVTLDPAQVTGPTLPTLLYDVRSYTSILNELTDITGYIWEIDYDKVLRMFLPGTTAAPFNIVDSVESTIRDIEVKPATQDYANQIIGQFGSGTREIIDTFVGDGSTVSYNINYFPLIAQRGIVNVGGVVSGGVITGGVNETLRLDGLGDPATWDYSTTTGVLTRNAPLGIGVEAYFQYTAQFPVAVTVNNTSEQPPIIGVVQQLPEVFDRTTATTIFNQRLARLGAEPRTVYYTTLNDGLATGMSQTITCAKRGLSAVVGYITEITERHVESEHVEYDVTFLEGTDIQNSWHDVYREWAQDTGGGGSSIAGPTGGTSTAGAAPPLHAVQHYALGGIFGGHQAFTFNPNNRCLVMGTGSTITATIPESCAIFGEDNHITD